MKAKEVRSILSITQQTLYNWTKEGKIKFHKISDHLNIYDDNSVYALIGNKQNKKNKKNNKLFKSIYPKSEGVIKRADSKNI